MEVAFHFNSEHHTFRGSWGPKILNKLFKKLLGLRPFTMDTLIRIGDLPLTMAAEVTERISENESVTRYDMELYKKAREEWIAPREGLWLRRMEDAYGERPFVVDFVTIDEKLARDLDRGLASYSPYLGARTMHATWRLYPLYSQGLSPHFRMKDAHLRLFWSGAPGGECEEELAQYKKLPFDSVKFEREMPPDEFLDEALGLK